MSGTTPPAAPAPTVAPMAAISTAATNEIINTWGRVSVSGFVLVMTLAAEVLSFLKPGSIDAGIIELLKTLSTGVVLYWVGSSASSTTKQGQIAAQTAMLAAAPPPLAAGTTTTTTTAGTTP